MPAGRNPNVVHDQKKERRTKKMVEEIDKYTPSYQSQNFVPPDTLTTDELVVWEWLVKIFREMNMCIVSDADTQLMELYCRAKVAADKADAALKKDNRMYILVPLSIDKEGKPKTTAKLNPNLKIRHDNMLLCLKYFDQLGLSPLARAKVGLRSAKVKEDEDIWKSILNRYDE